MIIAPNCPPSRGTVSVYSPAVEASTVVPEGPFLGPQDEYILIVLGFPIGWLQAASRKKLELIHLTSLP